MTPWAIYRHGKLEYLGLHENEDDAWRTFLGWPSFEEIETAKLRGCECKHVIVLAGKRAEP